MKSGVMSHCWSLWLDEAQGANEERTEPYRRYGERTPQSSNAAIRQMLHGCQALLGGGAAAREARE